jgi:hypothetical protein
MTVRQLHNLLRGLDDSRELVVAQGRDGDILEEVWRAAESEAEEAYAVWREVGGRDCYLAYRAAADRADAALDAVIAAHAPHTARAA